MIPSPEAHGSMSWVLVNTLQNPAFISGIGCGILVSWLWMKFGKKEKEEGTLTDTKAKLTVPEEVSGYDEGEYKMILVVRNDLKMGKGKVAAQCAHAAVDAVRRCSSANPHILECWQDCGQPKIVVKTDSEEDLKHLATDARRRGLVAAIITDAGRTQVAPNTKTVLAVGPGLADEVDKVTGHLRLY
ncbi:hypothetical protein R5R35_009906 [Gryllus longicercus]|uniref:peptidyl-tRNA hydrolase n=1 Tax=Gryllus longicercus TaxID=2509291 RepID=A0AAN9VSV9_9ORTH